MLNREKKFPDKCLNLAPKSLVIFLVTLLQQHCYQWSETSKNA